MEKKPSKHPDQIKRERIPTVEDLDTAYRPHGNFLMVIALPDIEKIGEIILPGTRSIQQDEGHIVAIGETVPESFHVGMCVTWGKNHEIRFTTDGNCKFVLINCANILMSITKDRLLADAKSSSEPLPIVRKPDLNLGE